MDVTLNVHEVAFWLASALVVWSFLVVCQIFVWVRSPRGGSNASRSGSSSAVSSVTFRWVDFAVSCLESSMEIHSEAVRHQSDCLNPELSAASDTTRVVLQKAERSTSSHTPKPTWTTWSPTTMRSQRAWRTCPPPTWESTATPGSTCSNITSPKGRAHSAASATRGGRPSTAVWSVPVVDRNMSGCTPYRALTSGTKLSGETFRFYGLVKNTNK